MTPRLDQQEVEVGKILRQKHEHYYPLWRMIVKQEVTGDLKSWK